MRKPVHLPAIGADHPVVSVWLAGLGDMVYAGDRLVEILIEGAIIDVTAPVTGRVAEKHVLPSDRVAPGQLLGTIEEVDE
jgi:pyruvate/2-oxoglutarate dehydrogenase complex dihydrolipoamide acyltransferase (E2) component